MATVYRNASVDQMRDRAVAYWKKRLRESFAAVPGGAAIVTKHAGGPDQGHAVCGTAGQSELDALVDKLDNLDALSRWVYKKSPDEIASETPFERECRAVASDMYAHCTLILDHMHNAFDYHQQGVLSRAEMLTWIGYIGDIGNHPIMLMTLDNWVREKYLSKDFYDDVILGSLPGEKDGGLAFGYFLEKGINGKEGQKEWKNRVDALQTYPQTGLRLKVD